MNKFLFYLLSFTWGLPMTLIGLIAALILTVLGYKPTKYGCCLHFQVGNSWGGVSLGVVFITDKTTSDHTKNHEHGHSIQGCYWGPLMPFVICIPSAMRYWFRNWYRKYLIRHNKPLSGKLPDYDSIWFEKQATKLGTEFITKLGEK